VKIASAEFVAGAQAREHLPTEQRPEIAFAGRSNVGKSSLLNMMLARKGLARTSSTPGCTRQINFFDVSLVGGPALTLVDLPGYGFARVSKVESKEWKRLLETYLLTRQTLQAVVVLVDARRGPEPDDAELVAFLGRRQGLPVFVAVTKLDKLSLSAQKPRLMQIARECGVRVIGTSAETGLGREALWRQLLNVTTHALPGESTVLGEGASEPVTETASS